MQENAGKRRETREITRNRRVGAGDEPLRDRPELHRTATKPLRVTHVPGGDSGARNDSENTSMP